MYGSARIGLAWMSLALVLLEIVGLNAQEIINFAHSACLPLQLYSSHDTLGEFHIDCYDASLVLYDIRITRAIVGYSPNNRCYHQPSDSCVQNVTQLDISAMCNRRAECNMALKPESITSCANIQSNYVHVWYNCIHVPIPHGESAAVCLTDRQPSQLLISCNDFTVHSGNPNIYYQVQILEAFQGYDESFTRCFRDPVDCSRDVTEEIRLLCKNKEVCEEYIHTQYLSQCGRSSNYLHIQYECIPYNNDITIVQESSSCTTPNLGDLPLAASFMHITCDHGNTGPHHNLVVRQAWYGYTENRENACTQIEADCKEQALHQYQTQCTGQETCEISLEQKELTECHNELSTNLHVQYECITSDQDSYLDICNEEDVTKIIHNEGFITSPDYPNQYPNNINCECEITTTNPETGVHLEMLDFNLEHSRGCNFDWIHVGMDQSGFGLPQCGKLFSVPTVESNYFHIRMGSDGSFHDKGFLLKLSRYSMKGKETFPGEIKARCRNITHAKLFTTPQPTTTLTTTTNTTLHNTTSLSNSTENVSNATIFTSSSSSTLSSENSTQTYTHSHQQTTPINSSTAHSTSSIDISIPDSTTQHKVKYDVSNISSDSGGGVTDVSLGSTSASTAISTEATIGIIIAAVAMVILIIVLAIVLCLRKRHGSETNKTPVNSGETQHLKSQPLPSHGNKTTTDQKPYNCPPKTENKYTVEHVYETIPCQVETGPDSKSKTQCSPVLRQDGNHANSDRSHQQNARKSDIYANPAFEGNRNSQTGKLNIHMPFSGHTYPRSKQDQDYVHLQKSNSVTLTGHSVDKGVDDDPTMVKKRKEILV